MRILVLGATGQIGYALAAALAQTPHQVSVLVRDAAKLRFPAAIKVLEAPTFTAQAFRSACQDVDHIIYGVGPPEQFMFDTSVFEKVNCDLLETFLEAMRASPARRLTYLSTYEVFSVVDGAIREANPVVDESNMTPYSQSKVRAYRRVVEFARTHGIALTTVHPAAVYGGLNTGDGITTFMDHLLAWRWPRVPAAPAGSFPVIHIDSLTDFIIKSLGSPGAFIVSDQMTSLGAIARAMRKQTRSYVPLVVPAPLLAVGVFLMEAFAKVVPVKPLTSSVQLHFITRGWVPDAAKAMKEIGWRAMSLEEGIGRFLASARRREPIAEVQAPASLVSLG